jgi:hypothetical protein
VQRSGRQHRIQCAEPHARCVPGGRAGRQACCRPGRHVGRAAAHCVWQRAGAVGQHVRARRAAAAQGGCVVLGGRRGGVQCHIPCSSAAHAAHAADCPCARAPVLLPQATNTTPPPQHTHTHTTHTTHTHTPHTPRRPCWARCTASTCTAWL